MSVSIWSLAIWSAEYHLSIMLPVLFCFVINLKLKIGNNRCCCRFQLGQLNDHLFGKELFIRLTVRVFCGCWSTFVCVLLSLLVLRVGFGM